MVYLFLILGFFLAACHPSAPASPTVAQVNGEKISLAAFEQYREMEVWKFGEHSQKSGAQLLDNYIREILLLQEAKRRGLTVASRELEESVSAFKSQYPQGEDLEKLLAARGWNWKDFVDRKQKELLVQKLVEQMAGAPEDLSEGEVEAYYHNHPAEFHRPEQVRARQIVTDSREKAMALREMILQGTDFSEVALKYSLSPDRKKGGDLGWFAKGEMPKEFDQVCFYLPRGVLSQVVATPYGFHLFQVLEKRPAGLQPLEEVRDGIRKRLAFDRGKKAFQKWYEEVKAKAEIKIYESLLPSIQ